MYGSYYTNLYMYEVRMTSLHYIHYIRVFPFRSLWSMRNYIHIMLCVNLIIAQLVFIIGIDKTENMVHTYIHTYIHIYIRTYVRKYMHIYLHTHYLFTVYYVNTHIRTYIHTYINTFIL